MAPTQGRQQDDRLHDLLTNFFDEIGSIDKMVASLNKARVSALSLGSEILMSEYGIHKGGEAASIDIEGLRGIVKGEIAFREGLRHQGSAAAASTAATEALAEEEERNCCIS